ncbi:hypothetical protein GCM10009676_39210 [Prauserella halophila]|uniref:TRAP-type C4-dicarboxylate transport system substrate-binding protein n=1 Tax=Prauserella halophila TaxID=185641 RepID=A0ABP4H3E0_9PSEU|nr:hypothetical protein [Prauserella halophila]MCP2238188.1 TRAP-type C4-dicarboxylate transport system, substrate-binding protein [Prauserella halophila]
MTHVNLPRYRRIALPKGILLIVLVSALILSACADPSADTKGGAGAAVPAGASKQDYIQAFQDIDPITMSMQTLSPKGALNSRPVEEYAKIIDEWSGGKIKAEISYSSSIASLAKSGEALADGRLDFARHAPLYQPDEYPETNKLVDLTFVGKHTPLVGRLQRFGSFIQTSVQSKEVVGELEEAGLKPVFPLWPISPMVMLACGEKAPTTQQDMNGLVARASGRIHAKQLDAMGITAADLDMSEIYQGLQRGVIDCGEMSMSTLKLIGALEIANQVSYSPETGFADVPGAFSFGQNFWEDLPLPARQLLWDKLDVLVEAGLNSSLQYEVEALKEVSASGGQVKKWSPEVVETLQKFNDGVLEAGRAERPELVRNLLDNTESWKKAVTGELGYHDAGDFADFAEWYPKQDIDLEPMVSYFMDNVMKPDRPS